MYCLSGYGAQAAKLQCAVLHLLVLPHSQKSKITNILHFLKYRAAMGLIVKGQECTCEPKLKTVLLCGLLTALYVGESRQRKDIINL